MLQSAQSKSQVICPHHHQSMMTCGDQPSNNQISQRTRPKTTAINDKDQIFWGWPQPPVLLFFWWCSSLPPRNGGVGNVDMFPDHSEFNFGRYMAKTRTVHLKFFWSNQNSLGMGLLNAFESRSL